MALPAPHFFYLMHKVEKGPFVPQVSNEDPDERANPFSLIWTFSVLRHILQYALVL